MTTQVIIKVPESANYRASVIRHQSSDDLSAAQFANEPESMFVEPGDTLTVHIWNKQLLSITEVPLKSSDLTSNFV